MAPPIFGPQHNPWRKRGTASRVHVALVGNSSGVGNISELGGTSLRHEGRAVRPGMDAWLPSLSLAYTTGCDFQASPLKPDCKIRSIRGRFPTT